MKKYYIILNEKGVSYLFNYEYNRKYQYLLVLHNI